MDKEHLKSAKKKAEGEIKETAGKVLDDKSLEAEGKADKAESKVREKVGDAKDALDS